MCRFVARLALASILLVAVATGSAFAGKVGPEFRINTTTTDHQYSPSTAAFPDGSFVVVWVSDNQDGDSFGVFGQVFDKKGKKKGKEFRVNTYVTAGQSQPAVAVLSDGTFVAAWHSVDQDGDGTGVYAQRFTAKGKKKGKEFRVNTTVTDLQEAAAIAAFPNGGFVVTWDTHQNGTGADIYGQRYNKKGKKQGAEFRVSTFVPSAQTYSRVAVLPDGSFVVVWESYTEDGSGFGVYGQRFNKKGKRTGGEFRVNTTTALDQGRPAVSALAKGGFIVVWRSDNQDSSGYGVYAQIYSKNGVAVGGEFRVNTTTVNDQSNPDVALLGNGNFVVTWQSFGQDGSVNAIVARKYKKNGAAKGGEFPVNAYTAMNQSQPRIAALAKRNFVIAWNSDSQDGDGYGVYGQRFK